VPKAAREQLMQAMEAAGAPSGLQAITGVRALNALWLSPKWGGTP